MAGYSSSPRSVGQDRQVLKSRRIAHHFAARRNVAQQAPHDLAAPSLRQRVGEAQLLGARKATQDLANVRYELSLQLVTALKSRPAESQTPQ